MPNLQPDFSIYADLPRTPPRSESSDDHGGDLDGVADGSDARTAQLNVKVKSVERMRQASVRSRRKTSNYTVKTGVSSMPPSVFDGADAGQTDHADYTVKDYRLDLDHDGLRRQVPAGAWSSERPRMRHPIHHLDGMITPSSTRSPRTSILTGDGLSNNFRRRHRISASQHITPSKYSDAGLSRSTAHRLSHDYRQSKDLPLVLLHVNLIASSGKGFDLDELKQVNAPGWLLENQRSLKKQLDATTLDRGLLLAHPGEEYDLLEERTLEALGLCKPRVFDCGHFNANYDQETHYQEPINEDGLDDLNLDDTCTECYHSVRDPAHGIGTNTSRYTLKIYAANGLLRAGAWCAAWQEMEKVDVEVNVWVPEALRRDLDRLRERKSEEQALQVMMRAEREEQEVDRHHMLDLALRDMQLLEHAKAEAEEAALRAERSANELGAELARLKEEMARGESRDTASRTRGEDAKITSTRFIEHATPTLHHQPNQPGSSSEIPISVLLRNCLLVLVTKPPRFLIALASAAILAISIFLLRATTPVPAHVGLTNAVPITNISQGVHSLLSVTASLPGTDAVSSLMASGYSSVSTRISDAYEAMSLPTISVISTVPSDTPDLNDQQADVNTSANE